MNTIPSTPNKLPLSYSVIGGSGGTSMSKPQWPISVLILNSSGRFNRLHLIENLKKHGFAEILCVEQGGVNADIEQQCRKFPNLRFILTSSVCPTGTLLNLVIPEAKSPFVLVMNSDLALMPFLEHNLEEILKRGNLCTVPLVRAPDGAVVPTLVIPVSHGKGLKFLRVLPSPDRVSTLYPIDYIGLYRKDRFIQSQGFDEKIQNPFWQKVDFGFRMWLWGERNENTTDVRFQAQVDIESEDSTPDTDYAYFYLKNLLPHFAGDHSTVPWATFFLYWRVCGKGLLCALQEFRFVRAWVQKNKYRFKHDARYVVELWDERRVT